MSSTPPAAGAPGTAPGSRFSTFSTRDGALVVALVAAAASWNVLLNGFVWDDNQNILQNRWVREPERVLEAFRHHLFGFDPGISSSYYRPVMHLVFAATNALAGLRPWAFHLVNLVAHAAMSACVYLVLVRWAAAARAGPAADPAAAAPDAPRAGRRPWELLASGPLVAALLFAVHPIHAQAVAWIAGIVDVSYSLFFLLAFLCATYEGPRRLVPLVAAPIAFLLSLLAKEPAIMLLPVVAIALALRGGLADPTRRRDALLRLGVLCAAVVAYLPLRVAALGGLMPPASTRLALGTGEAVATGLSVAAGYLRLLVFPSPLSALKPVEVVPGLLDARALAALAAILALGAVAWVLRRRADAVLGLAMLVLPLLPALHVPLLGEQAGAERYAYLPSVGAALLLSAGIEALLARSGRRAPAVRLAVVAAAAAALVLATAATRAHNAVWRDELTLWSDTIAKVPGSASAHESLGQALLVAGRTDLAIPALERAVALAPARAETRMNLASALVSMGRADEALPLAEELIQLMPGLAEAHGILGNALAAKGRLAEAVAAYERALALNPSIASVHNALAIAYQGLGRRELAIAHVREAMRLQPENPIFAENLAFLLRP